MIPKHNDDGTIWQSISDMMTGLMMIFLFVCMGFLLQMKETVSRYEQIKNQIHQDLIEEFKPEDMARLGAKIDEEDLRVIFVSPSVFFESGDSTVNPHFQTVLTEFFPRYIKVLEKYSAEIVEVRIEGNASLEWSGDVNSNDAYFYNMKLHWRQKIVDEFDIAEYLATAQKNKADFPPVEFFDVSAVKKEYVLSPYRKDALKKNADYICEVCRRKFSSHNLEIHHKNHNQGDNRRDNLLVVCKECNNQIHVAEGGVLRHADALKILGDIYSTNHDDAAAKNFYRKASVAYEKLSDDLDAQFKLANLYLREPKTLSRAKQLFESYLWLVKDGGIKAMIRCGLIYAKGLGVPKNLSKAQKFFKAVKLRGRDKEFFEDAQELLTENIRTAQPD